MLDTGDCDAAALLDLHWQGWSADGTIDPGRTTILASTPRFDPLSDALR
jgi:hypothetical protein